MARDKERSINPAQQQRKLEKAKALKKSRAELQTRRNEKLAKRNPDRIQRQIDDLKSLEAKGDIKPREKAILEELERDLRAVKKAREAVGDGGAPTTSYTKRDGESRNGDASVLGKRRYDGERKYSSRPGRRDASGSETDESVRRIPMPEDTPPPVPREFRRFYNNAPPQEKSTGQTGENDHNLPRRPQAPAFESKTTYSSAPQIRDLKKEAVSRFVPTVVRQKQDAVRGVGGQLVEPEELDRLEAAGYGRQQTRNGDVEKEPPVDSTFQTHDYPDGERAWKLAEEEKRFEQELAMTGTDDPPRGDTLMVGSGEELQTSQKRRPSRAVQIEEVEDEEG